MIPIARNRSTRRRRRIGPVVIASDDFNRTPGAAIQTGHSDWSLYSGANAIITSAGRCRPSTAGTVIYGHAGTYPDDYDVGLDVTVLTADQVAAGPIARLVNVSNFYHARYNRNGSIWELYRWVGGAATLLGSVGESLPNGSTRRCVIRCRGSNIWLIVDGTTAIGPVVDSNIASGVAGFRIIGPTTDSVGTHIDNWMASI